MGLSWNDSRPLGAMLFEKYDTLDPRTVRLGDMPKWVVDLEDFEGKVDDASEPVLRAIQNAWYERWRREYGS